MIISELWENAQEGRKIRGGSAVTNRALELIGKHLGMFQEVQEKPAMTLEELSKQPPEVLQAMDQGSLHPHSWSASLQERVPGIK